MSKAKLTVSLPQEIALYLRSKPNASAVVAEAVESYRVSELEKSLEEGYREGAAEAERLSGEWESADAGVED